MIRTFLMGLALLIVMAIGRPAFAQGQDLPEQLRQRLLERFDEDGDGKLTGQELAKAREAWSQRNRNNERDNNGQRGANERNRGNPGNANRPGQGNFNREQFLKRFDKNGDGQLDASERQAARAEFERLRQQFGGNNNAVGGGRGANGEQATPSRDRLDKRALLAQFDADGDGKLSPEEREKARVEIRKRRGT